MKELISLALVGVILLTLTACKSAENHTSPSPTLQQTATATPSPMPTVAPNATATVRPTATPAKIYYDYLISLGEIETERSSTTGGGFERWNVYNLYYYLGDFNDDGIVDLAISNEKSDSNGIEIYTYKNGQVKKFFSKGMPYSAGTEIFTLAKYDDTYGIKYLRFNSVGDFSFSRISKDATIEEMFSGCLYDIDGNVLDTSTSFDRINLITFYSIEELKKMF